MRSLILLSVSGTAEFDWVVSSAMKIVFFQTAKFLILRLGLNQIWVTCVQFRRRCLCELTCLLA